MDKSTEQILNRKFEDVIKSFAENEPNKICNLKNIRDKFMNFDNKAVLNVTINGRMNILVKNLDNLHVISISNLLLALNNINSFDTDNDKFKKYYKKYVGSPLMVNIDNYGKVQELFNIQTTKVMSVKTDFYSKDIPFISYQKLYDKYKARSI